MLFTNNFTFEYRSPDLLKWPGDLDFQIKSRGSSGVEQLIRNQQVVGSNPILGSTVDRLKPLASENITHSNLRFPT